MSGVKTILLHVDATLASVQRLRIALDLAARLDARITALFGAAWGGERMPYSASAALEDHLNGTRAIADREAKRRLQEHRRPGEADVTWCEVLADTIAHGFLMEAVYADLLVLGEESALPGTGTAPAGFVEAAILDSGRPALVIPLDMRTRTVGRRPLVAWNGSPQAARALTGALPLLRCADEVHVAVWSHLPEASPFARIDVGEFLNRHGVAPVMHRFDASPHITTEISSLATTLSADLVVMGCYGHSRAAERIFGGASRSALAKMAVPVLMAH